MICLIDSQVRFSVTGSRASAFQKLLIQSVWRVAMMSSKTARTSGLASLYSIKPLVDMRRPRWLTCVSSVRGKISREVQGLEAKLVPFQLNGASYLLLGAAQKAFRTEHSE